eukprot:3289168-Rhodomonas_salina.1
MSSIDIGRGLCAVVRWRMGYQSRGRVCGTKLAYGGTRVEFKEQPPPMGVPMPVRYPPTGISIPAVAPAEGHSTMVAVIPLHSTMVAVRGSRVANTVCSNDMMMRTRFIKGNCFDSPGP